METKKLCKLCGEKLKSNQNDALYYCMKCTNEIYSSGLFRA
jgi:NADH pyrophosphatase NudC (nudix superfamily)